MGEEGKKISFAFAKSVKKPVLVKQVPQEEKKVDYIECLDGKAIKVIGEEEKKEQPLVIPLLGPKSWHERLLNRIDADIFEPKATNENDTEDIKIKEEPNEESNKDIISINESVSNMKIKTEPSHESESANCTLEEQAAKEIVQDLKSADEKDKKPNNLTLPLIEKLNLEGKEESTLDDYEKIPVNAFGLAMLRGMGWKPGKGIGKNEKIATTVMPAIRPKGMGLGADKVALQKNCGKSKKKEEELQMEKGSFVKIIAGKQSNAYGQIEGFDEDVGRLIVKMALGGNSISVNECTVRAVTKAEYLKNSKVLNATKYEEYKIKESGNKTKPISPEYSNSSDEDNSKMSNKRKQEDEEHESRKSRKSKNRQEAYQYDDTNSRRRSRKRHSSSSSESSYEPKKSKNRQETYQYDDTDSRRRSRKRHSSSSSESSCEPKKSKNRQETYQYDDTDSKRRSRKRHSSSSSESSYEPKKSKKHKEKERERERTRSKRCKYSESPDRRKSKKHRSRSSGRR